MVPGQAVAVVPAAIALLTATIALLQKSKDTETKVNQVHEIVNSQRTEMMDKIDKLQEDLAHVQQSRAIERSTGAGAIREAVAGERESVRIATEAEQRSEARRGPHNDPH